MECNHYRFERRKVSEQGWEIDKMLDLMNVDQVGFGDLPINAPKKISTRVIQSTNDFPTTPSRLFLFITDPRASHDTGSTMCCIGISDILNN